jgi:hypothetical protein
LTNKTIKRIHVNQHNIKANAKAGNQDLPVFTVKNRGKTFVGTEIFIHGSSKLVYSPKKPLDCGAKVWIETTDKVNIKLPGTINTDWEELE